MGLRPRRGFAWPSDGRWKMLDIKPCPFCGMKAVKCAEKYNQYFADAWIICHKSDCAIFNLEEDGNTWFPENDKQLLKEWNKRA